MATTVALTLPLVPGQLPAWQAFVQELQGPRAAAFQAHRTRLGLSGLQLFHQPTPQGELVIWALSGAEPQAAFGQLAASEDAFDLWYVDQLQALHGMGREVLAQVRPGQLTAAWG